MRHQIILHNKLCLNKYVLIENQIQEEDTVRKVYKVVRCCDKLKQVKDDVFCKFGSKICFLTVI